MTITDLPLNKKIICETGDGSSFAITIAKSDKYYLCRTEAGGDIEFALTQAVYKDGKHYQLGHK